MSIKSDLVKFKKEVESELLIGKQIWIDNFAESFLEYSPSPAKTETSTGFFINQTNLKIGNRINRFNLNIKHKKRIRSKKFTSTEHTIMRSGLGVGKIMSTQQKFVIKNPYDSIAITNYVSYNKNIEILGWYFTGKDAHPYGKPPYRPFRQAKSYAKFYLEIYLRNTKRSGYVDYFQEILNDKLKRDSRFT